MISRKIVSLVLAIAGAVLVVAGGVAWSVVGNTLAEQNITVADDAKWFAGEKVDGPMTAYSQQDIINKHALESTGGKTYAEMDREDPLRAVQASASSLRASLFTSVLSFGVALLVMFLGAMSMFGAWVVKTRD